MAAQNTKLLAATVVSAYVVSVNTGAAALFWFDKQQAIKQQWRVSGIVWKKNCVRKKDSRVFTFEFVR
jgi:hypothetical protein